VGHGWAIDVKKPPEVSGFFSAFAELAWLRGNPKPFAAGANDPSAAEPRTAAPAAPGSRLTPPARKALRQPRSAGERSAARSPDHPTDRPAPAAPEAFREPIRPRSPGGLPGADPAA
jgi:hypothetical protein